jgi:hypothetical protein
MENTENITPDLARVQTVALKVMDYLDLLAEEGFTEVEIVTAMFLIGAKLSETLEEVVKDGNN